MKVIKPPKFYIYSGLPWMLLWSLIFIVVCINAILDKYVLGILAALIISIIDMIGIYLFLVGINCKIVIKNDTVTVINMLHQKKNYILSDLSFSMKTSKLNNDGNVYIWYNNKKIAHINLYFENYLEIFKLKCHK